MLLILIRLAKFMHPFQRKSLLRDKKRILKSLKGYNAIYSKLSKDFIGVKIESWTVKLQTILIQVDKEFILNT